MLHLLVACFLSATAPPPAARPSVSSTAALKPSASPTLAPAAGLSGTVSDPSGKPIARALVIVHSVLHAGEPPLTSRTDEQGRFRVALTIPGLVSVRVEAAGFAPQTFEKHKPGTPLQVRLSPGARILGVVRDAASRNPIQGARVQARVPGDKSTPWEPKAGIVETSSDAQGRFRLEGLGAGAQSVRATARGYGTQVESFVKPGSSIELLLAPGAAVVGRVRDPQEQPIAGAVVELEQSARGGFRPASRPEPTDSQGGFEILGLEPGEYRVVARHRAFGPAISSALNVAQDAEESVDLVLRPGVTVAGRLVSQDARPVPGSVELAELDGQPAPATVAATSKTSAHKDGRFRLAQLPSGRHVLTVVAPGFTPRRVEVSVEGRPVDIGDVTLETGLLIQGRVLDTSGAPVAEAELDALPAALTRKVYEESPTRSSRSDASGAFVIGGLTEGTYEVTAQAYGLGRIVRPIEAGATNVTLALEPAGSIAGTVVEEAGNAVTDFRVAAQLKRAEGDLRLRQRPYLKPFSTTDGRFVLDGVSTGTYVVDVSAPERLTVTLKDTQVQSGSTNELGRIVLRAGGSVRGSVVDTSGAAVGGARVTLSGGGLPVLAEPPRATTSGDGSFLLRGLPAGLVEIVASHPSYAEGRASGIAVDPAGGPAEARVVLGQGARLVGSVRQRDGGPIAGATIQVMLLGPDGRSRRSSGTPTTDTGPDGSFSFERLPVGPATAFLMAGAKNVQTSAQGRSIQLVEGQVTTVEFVVRDIRLTGIVTRAQAPLANASVSFLQQTLGMTLMTSTSGPGAPAAPNTGPLRNRGTTGPDGRFELLLDNFGRYGVSISPADGQARHYRTVEVPDLEAYDTEIDLGGAQASGIVLVKGTERPILGARLSFVPTKGQGTVSFETGADGCFQVDLEPGPYKVRATAPEFAPAQIALEVPTQGETRIVLSRGSALEGKVVDDAGHGVGGLTIRAFPQAETPGDGGANTRSLADGSFNLAGLLSQPYSLLAEAGSSGRFGVLASARPGASGVQLTLKPAARLLLRLVGPDGKPSAGARVNLVRVDGARLFYGSLTDSDASGTVEMLAPAGQLELRA